MVKKALNFFPLYVRSRLADRYARSRGLPGLEFARFGRHMGSRLILNGNRSGAAYLLTPVSSTRYFEFDFAASVLPHTCQQFLDVSSPRLFSLYVGGQRPKTRITMLNPDAADIQLSRRACKALHLDNVVTEVAGVDVLKSRKESYDCILSISVIEHISGGYDDRHAIRWMYDALKPGGRLILTVPVDRVFHDEYRESDCYGTQAFVNGRYFFSRHYDRAAIRERLSQEIGTEPTVLRWFGEKVPGRWKNYEQRWIRDGLTCTVDDQREMVDYFCEYASWEEMPGCGFAGLTFEKR